MIRTAITDQAIDAAALLAEVTTDATGATTLFVGTRSPTDSSNSDTKPRRVRISAATTTEPIQTRPARRPRTTRCSRQLHSKRRRPNRPTPISRRRLISNRLRVIRHRDRSLGSLVLPIGCESRVLHAPDTGPAPFGPAKRPDARSDRHPVSRGTQRLVPKAPRDAHRDRRPGARLFDAAK